MDAEERAFLTLALADGVGPRTVAALLEHWGSAQRVVAAGRRGFDGHLPPGRARRIAAGLRAARPDAALREARRLGQTLLTPAHPTWPHARLDALPDAPLALWLRGRLPGPTELAIAVVGTREAGHYGLRMARDLAHDLARAGAWIVSGLAVGVDGAAHAGALAAGTGATVAILGCGLDVPYPQEHLDLKEQIAGEGGVLSEHPPGTQPRPGHFPRRNRIVAALVEALVVVEAPSRSGALLTARMALDLGREVLSVPGPARRASFAGSHRLIRQGEAALCEGAGDVLEALGREWKGAAPALERPAPAAGAPLAVWGVLGETDVLDLDELAHRTALTVTQVATAVAELELDGRVARVPGLGVRRA